MRDTRIGYVTNTLTCGCVVVTYFSDRTSGTCQTEPCDMHMARWGIRDWSKGLALEDEAEQGKP